jgi:hypothetical protein
MKANGKMIMSLALGLLFSCAVWAQVASEDQIKQNWIDKNPKEYVNQGGQDDVVPEFKSKSEKQQWVKDNPQVLDGEPEFNSQEEKEEWVRTKEGQEPRRAETRDAILVFPDDKTFPVYVKTGNKTLDDDNYAQQKQEWINNNPDKYAKMSNPSPNKVMSAEEKKERMTVNETNKK